MIICAPTPALCHLYLAIFQIAWVLLKLIKVQFFLKLGTTWPSNLMNLLSRCPECKDVWGSKSRLLPTPPPAGRGVLGPLQLLLTAQLLPTTFLSSLHKLPEGKRTLGDLAETILQCVLLFTFTNNSLILLACKYSWGHRSPKRENQSPIWESWLDTC